MDEVAELDVAELQDQAGGAANLFKALSHESRLLILCNLVESERTVGELQELVNISQSALSQHLAILRKDGIVATRRNAQSIYYSLASEAAHALMATLSVHYCRANEKNKRRGS